MKSQNWLRRVALATSLLVPVTGFASLAHAQAPAPATDGNTVSEVTVTAQFRTQNLQSTPIAITAVNAEMLEQRNQTSIEQITSQAPNVTLKQNGAAFGSSMVAFIRGVGQTDFNFALEPGVGIYVDDVYYATLTGSVLDLLDVDRVEVLRGPQGTLAGKNSIGGAIKMYSKKPTGSGGYLEAAYGSYDRVDVRGAADFTIVPDKLFARISGASKHHDGYVTRLDYSCTHPGSNLPTKSVGNGCVLGHDGAQAFNAARIALRWLPNEKTEVNFSADATNDQSGVGANTLLRVSPTALGANVYTKGVNGQNVMFSSNFVPYGAFSTDPNKPNDPYLSYATYSSNAGSNIFGPDPYAPIVVPPINHFKTWGVSGDITYQLSDNFNFKSVTAYRSYSNQFAEQTDASPIGVQILLQRQKHTQFSEEARLNGSLGKTIDFTVGGFYLKQTGGLNARVGLPWVGFDFIHGPDTTPSRTFAFFGNAEWHVTDRLNVVGGVRWSDEKKVYTYFRHNGDGTIISNPAGYNGLVAGLNGTSATFKGSRVDWRVNADYKLTSDMMGYVSVSTGYKGGGVNPRPFFPTQARAFQPETLTAYEIGLKNQFFDRRMRLNLSAFYNDYKNIQLSLSSCADPTGKYPASPCALPSNVGAAKVKGLEAETEIHPYAGFEIDASISYLDFQYKKLNDPNNTLGITLGMVTPFTPKWKWSVGAQYEFKMGGMGTLTPRVDVSYQGSVFASAINDVAWNQIAAYTVANARLTWKHEGGWQAAVEITNLTDKLYYLTLFDTHSNAGYLNGQPAMPRTYAISVKKTF